MGMENQEMSDRKHFQSVQQRRYREALRNAAEAQKRGDLVDADIWLEEAQKRMDSIDNFDHNKE